MIFFAGESKPLCQIGQKHNECWNINWNRRHQELELDLEESLTMVANNSSNNGGVTTTDHREIK